VKTFFQSQSRNEARLWRGNKFASTVCSQVTLRRHAWADRDVHIVIAFIIRCCIAQQWPLEMTVDQELEIDDLSLMVSHASSTNIQRVTNIQSVQAEVVPVGILLATVSVDPYPSEGQCFQVRALLDQGSTLSFISESLSSKTPRTKRQNADLQIGCFGDNYAVLTRSKILFRLSPCAKPGLKFTTYVFQGIMTYATSPIRFLHSWPYQRNLELADPNPASRQLMHSLIGTDLYGSLLMNDHLQGPLATSMAQRTAFGSIIFSLTPRNADIAQVSHCIDGDTNSLHKFWEDEEIQHPLPLKNEDQPCKQHFISTNSCMPDGNCLSRQTVQKISMIHYR